MRTTQKNLCPYWRVIRVIVTNPHLGQSKVSRLLKSEKNVDIEASGVRNILLRENMNTTELQLREISVKKQTA